MQSDSLFKNRSLIVIGAAESVSGVGNWITTLAVYALLVFRGDGSVAETSGVLLAGLLPTLLFSPVAGWLCDRFDRRLLMVASEVLAGLAVTGLVFAQRLEWIYGLLVLQAIFTSIMTPARQAVVPELVSREGLTRANALLQQLAGIVKVGAPMLAGLALAALDPQHAIILDAVSYGVSAVLLSRLPALPARQEQVVEGEPTEQARQSILSIVRQSGELRVLFVVMFLAIFVIIGFDVLAPVFTRDRLGGDESVLGVLIGLLGLGTVIATVVLMTRRHQGSPWRDLVLGICLLAIIPMTQAAVSWLLDPGLGRYVFFAACLIGGVGNGLLTVQVSTLLQMLAPAGQLGRLGGAFQSTVVGGQLMGLFVTPILVPGLVTMDAYMAGAAVALVLVALFAGLSVRRGGDRSLGVVPAASSREAV